jgi:glycosyltransferase involved in cell wall biosynthesis
MSEIVVQLIAKLELGGAQKIVIDLMRELKNRGILMTGEGGKLYDTVNREFKEKHITLGCLKRKISFFYDIICFFKLRKKLIKLHDKYDLIILHTHGSKAGVLGRIVSGTLPFVRSVHAIHGFAVNPYIFALKRFIYVNAERIASCFGDVVIAVAGIHIRKSIEWGMSRKVRYYCVHNYVNVDSFRLRKKEGREIKIVTVANFKPQKNPLMWARVATEITSRFGNVIFFYIGDGPLRKKVENLLGGNKKIKILGWRSNISDLLYEMDIFFLPSRWEGLPLSVLEAMACGLPVVASAVDGTTEAVLDSITGYLVPPDDLNGYVEKLSELICDEKKRKIMGKRGRERVKKDFSYQKMIKKVFYIYKSLGFNKQNKQ